MRLASAEVKRLLAHGRRANAAAAGVVLSGRTLIREDASGLRGAVPTAGSAAVRSAPVPARIALAVPKRQLKRAVDRNRVKRVLRETFRQHQIRNAGTDMLVTLVALPKATVTASKRSVKQTIRFAATALFSKLAADIGDR